MTEKILGYALLTIGILIILFSAYSAYRVFTKQQEPIQLFNFNAISLDIGKLIAPTLTSSPDLSQELVSPEMINGPLNLSAHLLLMGFISSIGFKIASLGVMLIRPIVVKLKEKSESSGNSGVQTKGGEK